MNETCLFRLRHILICIAVLIGIQLAGSAQTRINLWEDVAPHGTGAGEGHEPNLTVYVPESPTGVGIVVCPGGGYGNLAVDHEGKQIAEWLNANGIAAFVLRYRHAPAYGHPVPMLDVQRALRTVRARAGDWGVDENRIGILGFSAGGHLAATASTQFDAGDDSTEDPIDRMSCRPDFSVLVYPVITMTDPHTHQGSRKNLLGEAPPDAMLEGMSAELQVNAETPPAFLVHTHDDSAVPSMNSILYYEALVKAGVPAELHVFEQGRHGLGLARETVGMSHWPGLCLDWLRTRGILR